MVQDNPLLAALAVPPWLLERPWIVSALIVVVGLGIYGFGDLLRLSLGRIWAIGGVCFRDAVRRRVLWITPLAMLGVLIVTQLLKPIDAADAIRQTIKFCLFTTAIVVTIIAVITAATNLPREIESRVIFTIVTKPVTRLEIVLGKLVGFARVSFLILLIMGIFSLLYLHLRAWGLERRMASVDATVVAAPGDAGQQTPGHGLLFAQTVTGPVGLQQYAKLPQDPDSGFIQGGNQEATALFQVPPDAAVLGLELHIGYEKVAQAPSEPLPGRVLEKDPVIQVQILDRRGANLVLSADALRIEKENDKAPAPLVLHDPTGKTPLLIDLPQSRRVQLTEAQSFVVQILGGSTEYLYHIDKGSILLKLANAQQQIVDLAPVVPPRLSGSDGRYGQQLHGPSNGVQPVAVYRFRDVDATPNAQGRIPFEFQAGIDRTGIEAETQVATELEITVRDRQTGKISPVVTLQPESNRPVFFTLPDEYIKGGDFDVILRNKTPGHVIGLTSKTLQLVSDREYFGFNLAKGLLVLWLFAILTASVALCCSSWLSWPITVVLTLLIILCRWVVSNLDIGTGLGGQFANEFFPQSPGSAQAVSSVVDGLTKLLGYLAFVLPDISSFGVTEQVERGVSISLAQLVEPVGVLLLFGLPLLTLAYIFLRNKEVAP